MLKILQKSCEDHPGQVESTALERNRNEKQQVSAAEKGTKNKMCESRFGMDRGVPYLFAGTGGVLFVDNVCLETTRQGGNLTMYMEK